MCLCLNSYIFFHPSNTHRLRTSILGLQDPLEVFEGTRLFGFRDGLLVVLQHLIDVRLRVETITARRVNGRLWAEADKRGRDRTIGLINGDQMTGGPKIQFFGYRVKPNEENRMF